jgi:hypothetical protein
VSRRQDLSNLQKRLERLNVVDYILQQRPNTKWKPVLVHNVHFSLYHLGYLLGAPLQLPEYIKASKTILALSHRRFDSKPYEDNLCAFQCPAFHLQRREELDRRASILFQIWVQYLESQTLSSPVSTEPEEFEGVSQD